jgi:hypothetical protein
MKGLITAVLAANLLVIAAHAQSTTPPGSSVGSSSPTASQPVNPAPQSAVIRILTPVANQKFAGTNSVNVRFEIVSPAASAGTPNFLIQLDGDDPVRTSTMEQTFSGLAPGTHSVTVQLVDANNTPISGSRAVVQFVVASQSSAPSRPASTGGEALNVTPEDPTLEPPQLSEVAVQQAPPSEIMAMSAPLPSAGSALPLISVIGFGVLVGGIASAMKTR